MPCSRCYVVTYLTLDSWLRGLSSNRVQDVPELDPDSSVG